MDGDSKGVGSVVYWQGNSYEDAWRGWLSDRVHKPIKGLPSILSWGVWIGRNKAIFQDAPSSLELIATQSVIILAHYP